MGRVPEPIIYCFNRNKTHQEMEDTWKLSVAELAKRVKEAKEVKERTEQVKEQLTGCRCCRVLHHKLTMQIIFFEPRLLKPIPLFGTRKPEPEWELMPVQYYIDQVTDYVHNWSQRDIPDQLTRARIIELKKRLRVLNQEYYTQETLKNMCK